MVHLLFPTRGRAAAPEAAQGRAGAAQGFAEGDGGETAD